MSTEAGEREQLLARIAELEQRVEELEVYKRRHGSIMASMNVSRAPILMVGADERVYWFNDTFCDMFGCAREDLSEASLEDVARDVLAPRLEPLEAHGEDVASVLCELTRRAGRQEFVEFALRGEERWFKCWVQTLHGGLVEGGRLIYFLDFSRSIRTRLELAASRARLEALIESLPFEVWMCDARGRYLLQNQRAIETWGDLRGETFEELARAGQLEAEVIARWREVGLRALAGEVVRSEIELEREGAPRQIDEVVAPVSRGEEIIGIVGFHMDLTPLREAQRRLGEQLSRSSRMEGFAQLSAAIARELEEHWEAIHGWSEAALEVADEGAVRKHLEAIRAEVTRGVDLTRELVVGDGADPAGAPALDLDELARDVVASCSTSEIVCAIRSEGVRRPVRGDRAQLRGLLEQLLRNAIDAMPAGGEVEVSLRRLGARDPYYRSHPWVEPGDWMLVRVRDEGEGMPPEVRSRVFDPYFSTREGRQGLGLTHAYNIVQRHGGHISINSAPGRGTTVDVLLPVVVG